MPVIPAHLRTWALPAVTVVGKATASLLSNVALLLERTYPPRECVYCCEEKPHNAFPHWYFLPADCWDCLGGIQGHRANVCKTCLTNYIATKLETEHPLDITCPKCGLLWPVIDVEEHFAYASPENTKIFEEMMKQPHPTPHKALALYRPPEDARSLKALIKQRSKLCPYCATPFTRISGCNDMRCGSCRRRFYMPDAPSVADAHEMYLRGGKSSSAETISAHSRRPRQVRLTTAPSATIDHDLLPRIVELDDDSLEDDQAFTKAMLAARGHGHKLRRSAASWQDLE